MAGLSLHAPTPSHARQPPRHARPPALVEASVTILGKNFRTAITEGATVDALIEKVARENGGWVSRRFYPEFNASEIVAVKIGGELLVKSTEAGIHWSLGEAGIPMAVVGNRPVFPNGEELRVGRNISNIALWTTSSNFDPGDIRALEDRYSASGGLAASADALERISKAHGGVRSEKLMLEDNMLVLNKDTGELLTLSQHASRSEEPPAPEAWSPAFVAVSLPCGAVCAPAVAEPSRTDPALADAFRSGKSMIVRTFDGALSDLVRVQFRPLGAQFFPNSAGAQEATVQGAHPSAPIPQSRMPRSGARPLAFCMLGAQPDGAAALREPAPVTPDGPADAVETYGTKRADGPIKHPAGCPTREGASRPPSIREVLEAWGRPRYGPAGLPPGFSGAESARAQGRRRKRRRPLQAHRPPQKQEVPVRRKSHSRSGIRKASDSIRKAANSLRIKERIRRLGESVRRAAARAQQDSAARNKPRAGAHARAGRQNIIAASPIPARKSFKAVPLHPPRDAACRALRAKPAPASAPARELRLKQKSRPAAGLFACRKKRKARAIPHIMLLEMLGFHWKKRGRKFRMKKNRAP